MASASNLASLGQQALAFAKCYVALTEALLQQGVPEPLARQEARTTAAMAAFLGSGPTASCTVCGNDI